MHESFPKEINEGSDFGENLMRSAAVRYKGEIFTSPLHIDARSACVAKFPNCDSNDIEEGYVTQDGKFLDRNEAYLILEERDKNR